MYQNWITGTNQEFSKGFLRLRGKPGSGKSVLMKEAYRKALRITRSQGRPLLAAVFFNTKGSDLEHSRAGCLRSLLHQLLPQDRGYFSRLVEASKMSNSTATPDWTFQELEATLRSFLLRRAEPREAFIFLDGVDECDGCGVHILPMFWRELTMEAHHQGISLNVMLSCRNVNATNFENCPDISIGLFNKGDISTYVDARFRLGIAAQDPAWPQLRDAVLEKCCGVFLWVVLVVDGLIEKWEEGEGVRLLLEHLDELPQELDDLFSRLFTSHTPEMKNLTWRLFSWAALSTRPLRLHEWHHVLAFIENPALASLQEWQGSWYFTGTDGQLERKIRQLSRGLLEIAAGETEPFLNDMPDTASARAGAGSFELVHGETRVVQLIHGSVRRFFLDKFSPPYHCDIPNTPSSARLTTKRTALGHIVIMEICLVYLHIAELDALVSARNSVVEKRREKYKPKVGDAVERFLAINGSGNETTTPSSEALRKRYLEGPGVLTGLDVYEWIQAVTDAISAGADNDGDVDGPASLLDQLSDTAPSVKSQVLEAYPALLPYVVDEFFSHARAAYQLGGDLTHIFIELNSRKTWSRWLALSEDDSEPDFYRYLDRMGLQLFQGSKKHRGTWKTRTGYLPGRSCEARARTTSRPSTRRPAPTAALFGSRVTPTPLFSSYVAPVAAPTASFLSTSVPRPQPHHHLCFPLARNWKTWTTWTGWNHQATAFGPGLGHPASKHFKLSREHSRKQSWKLCLCVRRPREFRWSRVGVSFHRRRHLL